MIDLLSIDRTELSIERLLGDAGTIRRAFRDQDSGCVSYLVETATEKLFVKSARTESGGQSLARAEALHSKVRHPALPPLLNTLAGLEGSVHVYAAVPGEVLYDYVTMNGDRGRQDPASAHARFRALPVRHILDALGAIFDLHVRIAAAGFIAVDLYDGCILYDFEEHRTWTCDIDEYRPGPFILEEERLPGSRRFMAPEEFVRGSTIDQQTNVFTLARTGAVLLGDGDVSSDVWRGSNVMREVVVRATSPECAARFATVAEFVSAWRGSTRQETAS